MADLAPVFSAQPHTHHDQPAHERECPGCGGVLTVPVGAPLPPHKQFVMTPTGPQEGNTPCGPQRASTPTVKH